jgi:phage tail sheath gpL-like
VLRSLKGTLALKYGSHKLADDGTRYGAGQAIVTPSVIRGEIISLYRIWEDAGLVENADAFGTYLVVERNALDASRIDILFPPDLVNQCRVFAVLAQFRLQYPALSA